MNVEEGDSERQGERQRGGRNEHERGIDRTNTHIAMWRAAVTTASLSRENTREREGHVDYTASSSVREGSGRTSPCFVRSNGPFD